MFAGTSSADLASGTSLHLAWAPNVRVLFDSRAAQWTLGRLRSRALALQIALLYSEEYPKDTPCAVERRLVREGLVPSRDDSRLLAQMARRGMPHVPLPRASLRAGVTDPATALKAVMALLPRNIRHQFGSVIRKHGEFINLLNDPIWRLLDPSPITAATLTDVAVDLMKRGVNSEWFCRVDGTFTEPQFYELLLQIALSPKLGRPLALRCALIELRFAESVGDLARYESCLRAIPDIASTRVPNDALFDALTGIPCEGTRVGLGGSWLLADEHENKIMHLQEFMVATFSRVLLSQCVLDNAVEVDAYLRSLGLELDGPPRFIGPFGRPV